MLHCHYQNDFCIRRGSVESHFNVSFIVMCKVTRQCKYVNMVFNVHRNHKAYWGRGEGGGGGMEVGGEGDYIPIATLSPAE